MSNSAVTGVTRQGTDFPSYQTAYTARYAHTVLGTQRIGSTNACLINFERAPGRYPEVPSSDYALMMVTNGGFGGDIDLGAGAFSVKVTPGQLFLAPPYTLTEKSFHGIAKGSLLAIAGARLSELLNGRDLTPQNGCRELYTRPLSDDFIRSALNQLRAISHSPSEDNLFADAAVFAIFAALARHGKSHRNSRAGHVLAEWQLRRVMEKLESMQNISLAELAASANLSPFYFARAFKLTTGLAPHSYQLRLRMDRAKDLLRRTRLSVTEVALRVGYGSSQTLAREFRKEAGLSPVEYRRGSA